MGKLKFINTGLLVLLGYFALFAQGGGSIPRGNNLLPYNKCAPSAITWDVWFYEVKPVNGNSDVVFQVNWDDGSGTINYTYSDDSTETNRVHYNAAEDKFYARFTYTYNSRNDGNCSYSPSVRVVVNHEVIESSGQNQTVVIWDNDNSNGGVLSLDPQEYQVCVGEGAVISFSDISQWNCVPPDENDYINQAARWIQWIYGTTNEFDEVFIDGVPLSQGNTITGDVEKTTAPIQAPAAPLNQSAEITIPPTTQADLGKVFEITLNNWNQCNPYDGGFAPLSVTARIIVIDKPHIVFGTMDTVFCQNDPCQTLSAAPAGGTWSGNGVSGNSFCPKTVAAGTHTLYYEVSSGNNCSAIDSIIFTVNPSPKIKGYPNFELCTGASRQLSPTIHTEGTPPYNYLWTIDSALLDDPFRIDPVFTSIASGTNKLKLRVTDMNGCFDTERITITSAPVSTTFPFDTLTLCEDDTAKITLNTSGGSSNYDYRWAGTGASFLNSPLNTEEPDFIASQAGTFILVARVNDTVDAVCEAEDSLVIVVKNKPAPFAGTNKTICGLECTLDATLNHTYPGIWEIINAPENGEPTLSEPENPNATLSVTRIGDYLLRWIETNGNCENSDTVTLSFIEIPNPNAGKDDSTCGLTYLLNASASIGNANWYLANGPGTAVFVNDTLASTLVTVSQPGEYHFAWLEDNGNNCSSEDTVKIQFFEVPEAGFSMNDTSICSPGHIIFSNQSPNPINGETYLWDLGSGVISTDENPVRNFVNSTHNDQVYTINQIITSPEGCRDTASHNIVVHPSPKAGFSTNYSPDCSPVEVEFTNTSGFANRYAWNYGDASETDSTENPTHTFINGEQSIQYYNIELTATDANGCSDTYSEQISVFPRTEYDFTIDTDSSCSPAVVIFNADAGAFNYQWNFGNGLEMEGNPFQVVDYMNNGDRDTSFHVQLISTSQYGCKDTTYKQVVIHPEMKASFGLTTTNRGCTPFHVEARNLSVHGSRFIWNFGDGTSVETNTLEDVAHTYTNDQNKPSTYELKLVAESANGCTDSITQVITVDPIVSAAFSYNEEGCSPLQVQFINQSAGANFFNWNFGDGSSPLGFSAPFHSFENNGTKDTTYQVSLKTTSLYGCADSTSKEITVHPAPEATIEVLNPANNHCSPLKIGLVAHCQNVDQLSWDFGNGTTAKSIPGDTLWQTYTNATGAIQFYSLKVEAESAAGCLATASEEIQVFPGVKAEFQLEQSACAPYMAQLNNFTQGATNYLWEFGDGTGTSSEANPMHTFINETNNNVKYPVQLTTLSGYGCTDTLTKHIEILPGPHAEFEILGENKGCTPLKVDFRNLSYNGNKIHWEFGDGEEYTGTDKDISHLFINNKTNAQDFEIKLRVENELGCFDTYIQTITVYPKVTANFEAQLEGCNPLDVDFTNTSSQAGSYQWSFGDGTQSTEEAPSHIFTNKTTNHTDYQVSLVAVSSYGCRDTIQKTASVYASPKAEFNLSPKTQIWPGATVNITNLTPEGDWNYSWNFGDGKNTKSEDNKPLSHTYSKYGQYNITLKAANKHCSDKLTRIATIDPALPIAGFEIPESGCAPQEIQFINTSQQYEFCSWDFGDGFFSTKSEPTHTYWDAGTYTVKLVAYNAINQTDSMEAQIEIYEKPKPHFSIAPYRIKIPGNGITCVNLSESGMEYLWSFGDGETSTEQNPYHEYKEAGKYQVELRVISKNGCEASRMDHTAVMVEETIKLKCPNAFTPSLYGGNGGTYEKGDPYNQIFYPIMTHDNPAKYKLSIFNRWGNLLFVSHDVGIGWDGYYQGRLCTQGVYVWRIDCVLEDGSAYVQSGDVTLIR